MMHNLLAGVPVRTTLLHFIPPCPLGSRFQGDLDRTRDTHTFLPMTLSAAQGKPYHPHIERIGEIYCPPLKINPTNEV